MPDPSASRTERSTAGELAVGDIVEERHRGTPWDCRQQAVVIATDDDSVTVKWHKWGSGHRIPRDRIGNGMTDLIRPVREGQR